MRTCHSEHGLASYLPGLLAGLHVQFYADPQEERARGVILGLGHWYGPGRASDQALVRWTCTARPGQRYGNRRPMPAGHQWQSESVHYLSELAPAAGMTPWGNEKAAPVDQGGRD
jgi:hypothetical protein